MRFKHPEQRASKLSTSSRTSGRLHQRGQTATEYMLVISVMVLGVVFVTYRMFDDGPRGPVKQALTRLLGEDETSGPYEGKNIPSQVRNGYITANPQSGSGN